MTKYLREKSPDFKFSLHDAKIIDIEFDYGENRLIFKTQSGFIDIERNEMVDGEIILKGVSWDNSYVYIMEYKNVLTGNVGRFIGEKMYLGDFVGAFDSKFGSFDVMSEYDSCMTYMLSGFLKRGNEDLEANIEIFYNGDFIYNVKE